MTSPTPLSDSLEDALRSIQAKAQSSAVILADFLKELGIRFLDRPLGQKIQAVLADSDLNHKLPTGLQFSFKNTLESAAEISSGFGHDRAELTPELAYFGAVDGKRDCCMHDVDRNAILNLRTAGLCLLRAPFLGAETKVGIDLGINLSAAARAWSAPPLGEFTDLPKSIRHVLVQLFAGYQVPLLVGEPGVGKSTVAKQIAYMLFKEDDRVHPSMHAMQVLSVSRADLVAGTNDRGDLETNVQKLVSLADRRTGNIVFLDEIHAMFDGSDEARVISNVLKPPMAEGKLRCFGATTRQEFDKYLTADPPLLERFKLISVQEPERDSLVDIFKRSPDSILSKRELDGWTISPDAMETGVDLSIRFMPLQRLPRKAANLLRATVAECRFDGVGRTAKVVSPKDVQRTIQELVGLPEGAFEDNTEKISERLAGLIKGDVKGHNSQIDAVARHVCSQEKLREKGFQSGRPVASFILFGPPNIGKRALVDSLAKHHFAQGTSAREFVSEAMVAGYEGEQGLNRFRGPAPGFVGFGESPPIYRDPRSSPRRVILVDGLDSASGLAHAVKLIVSSGIGFDGGGRMTDYSGCVIILLGEVLANDLQRVHADVDLVVELKSLNETALVEFAQMLLKRSRAIADIAESDLLFDATYPAEIERRWRDLLTAGI